MSSINNQSINNSCKDKKGYYEDMGLTGGIFSKLDTVLDKIVIEPTNKQVHKEKPKDIEERFEAHLKELLDIADKKIKREYHRNYYKKNKEAIRKQQKEYYNKTKY